MASAAGVFELTVRKVETSATGPSRPISADSISTPVFGVTHPGIGEKPYIGIMNGKRD
jgi:hypothetical protein